MNHSILSSSESSGYYQPLYCRFDRDQLLFLLKKEAARSNIKKVCTWCIVDLKLGNHH